MFCDGSESNLLGCDVSESCLCGFSGPYLFQSCYVHLNCSSKHNVIHRPYIQEDFMKMLRSVYIRIIIVQYYRYFICPRG